MSQIYPVDNSSRESEVAVRRRVSRQLARERRNANNEEQMLPQALCSQLLRTRSEGPAVKFNRILNWKCAKVAARIRSVQMLKI